MVDIALPGLLDLGQIQDSGAETAQRPPFYSISGDSMDAAGMHPFAANNHPLSSLGRANPFLPARWIVGPLSS